MSARHSWETGKEKVLGKQELLILCTAIYEMQRLGQKEPKRARVLAFIAIKKLLRWKRLEDDYWEDEEGEIRENVFSACRDQAANEGYLSYGGSRDRGIWKLSDKGRTYVERKAAVVLQKDMDDLLKGAEEKWHIPIVTKELLQVLKNIGNEKTVQGD